MREIELKFKIDNMDNLLNKLEELGCSLSDVIEQEDVVFVSDLDNVESVSGSVWLRIRKMKDKTELNFKKQVTVNESKEIEFCVDDFEAAQDFLKALGFKEWVRVAKARRYSKYKDLNICLDKVERLGSFIELEYLAEEDDNNSYEDMIKEVALELGIDVSSIVDSFYDTMIHELDMKE